jgi:hypothetical protein
MYFKIKRLLLLLALCAGGSRLPAQALDFMNRISVVLDDGTNVTLYGAARTLDTLFTGEYYYLPTGLRLSNRLDGTPEFLFLKYTSEERSDAGGVQGALMHFLMTWGLTPKQESELQSKVAARVKGMAASNPRFRNVTNPRVMGAALVKSDPESSFQIVSAVLTNQKMTQNLVTSGHAPLLPGGKVAVGALMEKNGAQLLAATFEKNRSISDVSVTLRFKYDLLMPAVQGRITVNWEKIDSVYRHYKRDAYHHDGGDKGEEDDTIDDKEADTLFSIMQETKAVDVQLDNLQPESEIAKEMVSAFMEYFLRSVSEKEFRKPDDDNVTGAKDKRGAYGYGYNAYHIDQQKIEQKIARRKETYDMRVRLPITQELTLTENIASWYDHLRDNKKCVNTVNLNDPFFEHRDIYLILDLDAEEMFGKELNYVTVDLRKRRDAEGAHDFSKTVTFDQKFFKETGNRAVVTYSKAQDDKPDLFEYKVQWSLRGGNVFPKDTSWTQGTWEGVTLAPPVAPVPIRFEADLEDLKTLDIKNVTLQLRYYKFGREVESNLPITLSSNVGYLERNIFMDRNTQGYAYRLVFTHKDKGPLATPWDAKINTGYVYAVVPEELRRRDQEYINKAIDLAKEVVAVADGKEVNKGAVLDKFKDLIKTE